MDPIALYWQQDYNQAVSLFKLGDTTSLQQSFELFTRSVKSFPDSWLARDAHSYRAIILKLFGKNTDAINEERRVSEFYVHLD